MHLTFLDVASCALGLWLVHKLISKWRGTHTTPLRGPKSESFFFGLSHVIKASEDPSVLYEQWNNEYGSAYCVPTALGSSRVVILDPKALSHFHSRETFGYAQIPISRMFIRGLFGPGLLWAEGESHRRQRKALSPAFSTVAVRKLASVFYDSAYKLKSKWDSFIDLDQKGETVVDVQQWMDYVSLDSVGIAGFGHDFGTLDGNKSAVVEIFSSLTTGSSLLSLLVVLLASAIPILTRLPTRDNRLLFSLRQVTKEIADQLLERTRKEKEELLDDGMGEKSMIGLLVKAGSMEPPHLQMTHEEIMAQNVLLIAGYGTTSLCLTWALIELSRKPDKQQRLREELSHFSGIDPTWEQLASGLPYLDGVVHEILRLHPPLPHTIQIATEDDVIPLSNPVTTSTGSSVNSIFVKKGTIVQSPIGAINESKAFWGPNAHEFEPERWFDNFDIPAKLIQGHRHILTFSDGPRICLGRHFAIAELKAVLSVLVRNFTFELVDGPNTKIEIYNSLLPRPKVAELGRSGVPLRIRRVQ